ncbi:MAG: LptF/LptG family permease [Opitutae bacterium]|nr:LptF/LptG family permease [Opitutae bacterium]
MKLLHRHITASVASTCLAAVGVLTFVIMLANVMKDLLGYLLAGQLALDTFVRLVALLAPFAFSFSLPMGMLTGVLLVLGRMSADREITAIRASGMSVAGISAPILFLAVGGAALSTWINFYAMPYARVAYHRELADAVRTNPLSFIVPKTFIREFPGRVIYVGDKRGEILRDFWIWETDGQGRVRRSARAETGRLAYDEANNKLILTLEHVQVEARDDKDPENFAELRGAASSDRATFDLPLSKLTGAQTVNVKMKWLNFDQLLAEWRRLGQPDPKLPTPERERLRVRVQTVIQEKFATGFSVIAFALMAIPLGIKVSRKETSANLGIAVALALSYYFMTVVVGWFDNKPDFRPDLLMWIPNIGFQALGAWMFYKVDRQ